MIGEGKNNFIIEFIEPEERIAELDEQGQQDEQEQQDEQDQQDEQEQQDQQ
jgi:hypothetical protein